MLRLILSFVLSSACSLLLISQDCVSGAVLTHDAYLYGRFEVAMKSAAGDGVVSSFFLYNSDVGCNWPAENNEIDIEMTGNDETVQFTTHYPPLPGQTATWSVTENETYGFNPHADIHHYAFEWEPGIVRWFIDGQLTHVQDASFVDGLIHPMRIHMNLWAAGAESWVGIWDPSIMPLQSEYEYVRCYDYTPGMGNIGTNNNFTLLWEDEFDSLDEDRWAVSQFGGFGGNFCSFESTGVEVSDGKLILHMEEPSANNELIPVTFTVDASDQNFDPDDYVFLNGGFNDWCGNCQLMDGDNGVWSVTVSLPPGRHEYLFTKNFWEENGSAPQGSSCDFQPCDEWMNYGLILDYGDEPLILDTVCWGQCSSCTTTALSEYELQPRGALLKITNILGHKTRAQSGELLFYHYANGAVIRKVFMDE